ncbi:hypothetical protein ACHAPA_009621 [Fusarium lateritium]
MPSRTEFFGYGFSNLGPLTTTYEPPASCTTATTDRIYFANATSLELNYGAAKCDGDEPLGKCYPSGKTYDSLMSEHATYRDQGTWNYFSPGVACPKGWTTAGTLAHGDKTGSVEKTGVFTQPPFPFPMRVNYLMTPEEIWLNALDPSETLAYCCPSGWDAGQWGGCFSSIEPLKSATYSDLCRVYAPASARIVVHTVEGSSVATPLVSYRSVTDLTTTTIAISELKDSEPTSYDDLAVVRQLPGVALVFKESDVKKAKDNGDEKSGEAEESESAKADDDNGASTLNGGSFVPLVAVLFSMLVGAGMLAPGF